MSAALVVATSERQSYATTATGAALRAVYASGARVRVERINSAGRFATVMLGNALMEGTPVTEPILVEHFSFGWQALEVLNFRCRLSRHPITSRAAVVLLEGVPAPPAAGRCDGPGSDVGPQALVEALRRLSPGPLTPYALVRGSLGVIGWYGAGGGQDVFLLHDRAWVLRTERRTAPG
jgi:hypothetical protein